MMDQRSDMDLLRDYAERGAERAFTALVARHLPLVYRAALRQTQRPAVAEEIAQTVFTLLARKAAKLGPGTIVAGWLVKTTRFVAKCALRDDARRRRREEEVSRMSLEGDDAGLPAGMESALPILDESLACLRAADRDALVLRYLEGKSFGEVARALGATEEAARKRVQRALERLRGLLGRRGVPIGAAALSAGLDAASAQAIPAGLEAAVVGAKAVAKSSGEAGISPLTQASLRALGILRWKVLASISVSLIFAAGMTGLALHRPGAAAGMGKAGVSVLSVTAAPAEVKPREAAAPLAVATRRVLLRIVDEKGRPIPDAYVDFGGGFVQAFSAGAEGLAPGMRISLLMEELDEITRADARGVIELQIPKKSLDAMNIESIVVPVRAPGFVFADAKAKLASPETVVPMTRGETLAIKIAGAQGWSARPYAFLGKYQGDYRSGLEWGATWTRPASGVLETHLPKESYVVMGVELSESGPRFSPPRILQSRGAGREAMEFRSVPERRVYGRLDGSVPRPVMGGRVIACALAPAVEEPRVKVSWQASGDIAADGTFDIGPMPEGELKVVAYCQGYVSEPDLGKSVVLVTPQGFPAGALMPLVVRMVEDARLRVRVRDVSGRPVAGANVILPITQNLDGFCASHYRSTSGDTAPFLQNRQGEDGFPRGPRFKDGMREITDAQGVAVLENLPLVQTRVYVAAKGYAQFSKDKVQIGSGDNALDVVLKPVTALATPAAP